MKGEVPVHLCGVFNIASSSGDRGIPWGTGEKDIIVDNTRKWPSSAYRRRGTALSTLHTMTEMPHHYAADRYASSDHVYKVAYDIPISLRLWTAKGAKAKPWLLWLHGG